VAIVQISRITNRKGLAVDLPQPLAGAELGWAIDQRRLFIGNGELSEGAPVVGNTEILTEFSDVINLGLYTYQGLAGGYVVQTGPTPSTPVTQTIQQRLDSYAVATDFGIIGDGVTDQTDAINRALYQLYCIENDPAVRRGLFFPAGNYIITGTLNIPAYATLYGEGASGTKFNLYIQDWTDTIAWPAGVTVAYDNLFYKSKIQVILGASIGDTVYWEQVPAPEYIWRTADSLQQTGISIASNSATPPRNISIIGIEFSTNVMPMHGCLIEDAYDVILDGASIIGPMTPAEITEIARNTVVTASHCKVNLQYQIHSIGTTDFTLIGAPSNTVGVIFTATGSGAGTGTVVMKFPDTTAVRFASTDALVTSNIKLINCNFSNFWATTIVDQQVTGVVITGSTIDTMYRGVVLGGDTVVNGGPSGFRVTQNVFDNIYWNGVYIQNASMNATGYNIFFDVGNEFNGHEYPSAPIIDIYSADNICVGDLWQRANDDIVWAHETRIRINETRTIVIDGNEKLILGPYERSVGVKTELADSVTGITLFEFDASLDRALAIDYTIVYSEPSMLNVRTGTLTVVCSGDDTNNPMVSDSYTENGSTGVSLDATQLDSIVSVVYSTTVAGATISYSAKRLA
jgi:hypothetical protein